MRRETICAGDGRDTGATVGDGPGETLATAVGVALATGPVDVGGLLVTGPLVADPLLPPPPPAATRQATTVRTATETH